VAIPLSYNLRSLMQRPASSLATALGIAFVVAVLVGALALASGFQAAMVRTGSPANLIVLRRGADGELSSGIGRDGVNVLRSLPDIAVDAGGRPLVSAELLVLVQQNRRGGTGSSNVPVRGIDAGGLPLRSRVAIVAGRLFAPGTDEVVVGARMARRFDGLALGDRLRFGQREFTVVGHFDAAGSAFESEIWGDINVLGPALGRDNVFQSVTFTVRDTSRIRALRQQIETDPRLGVQVRTEREFYAEQSRLLTNVIRVAGVFLTAIMALGAVFGAMNTMFAAVGARTREIATLFVLGFSPLAVMVSFLFESVLLALAGGALGCLIALPINGITTSTTNWSTFSELAFAFRVTPAGMLAGMIFALVLGVVGGFLPALRAARQSLASSLRGA
jgi:ABC-type antimicrobial peptide transport system permease subunit